MKADHKQIVRLLKTARGQIDGILGMVEEDRYCIDISNQLMATTSILRKVNREIIKAHLSGSVKEAFEHDDESLKNEKIEEIISIFEKLDK